MWHWRQLRNGDNVDKIIVRGEHLKKYYGEGDSLVRALDDVSLEVYEGEFVAITGASGSGKTTLLHLLGGLDIPTAGKVWLEETDMYAEDEEERTVMRREGIGFVFQSFRLVPALTVYENIVLPMELDDAEPDREYFDCIIRFLGLDQKLPSYPQQLSGGQQQRVAIARALLMKPQLLLADEPTGNLDVANAGQVMELLQESSRQFGQTIVMITHNREIAARADRIICLEDGKVKKSD